MKPVAALTRGCLFSLALLASCSAQRAPDSGRSLTLQRVASGLEAPLYLTAPARDPRLFVVEQPGRIRILRDGRLLARPFLDLTARVSYGGERGLLSMAFSPRYATDGSFYVNYTDRSGDTRVERYRASRDPDVADPASAELLLRVDQPYANHNGGHVLFGLDGMLYVGMGDGGSGGDPHGHGQNAATLLGKLLRIDVSGPGPYRVPPDNPFVGRRGARAEIWAIGLRNPWRICFDSAESMLYIADVGQNQWEEIHAVPAGRAGLNYGWNVLEGNHCYRARNCDRTGMTPPVLEYDHGDGCSITGGFVYRGSALPEIVGHYFYADYCTGWVRSFRLSAGRATQTREWGLPRVGNVTSFGQDSAGELYVCSSNGSVYRLTNIERGQR